MKANDGGIVNPPPHLTTNALKTQLLPPEPHESGAWLEPSTTGLRFKASGMEEFDQGESRLTCRNQSTNPTKQHSSGPFGKASLAKATELFLL